MTAAIDVVIASYNGAAKLQRCLRTLLPQAEDGEMTISVVLDGSTDDSDTVLKSFEDHYPLLTVLRQPRRGLAMARNTGAAPGTAPWVFFLDDDTELAPGFAPALLRALDGTDADVIGLPDLPLASDGYIARSIRYLELASRRVLERQLAVKGAALVCRRDVFEAAHGFDEERAYYQNEDIEFTQRASSLGYRVCRLDAPVIRHEAPTAAAYASKSWRALATHNDVESSHYYRLKHSLVVVTAIFAIAGFLLQSRQRGRLVVVGSTAAMASGAGVAMLGGGSPLHAPGVLFAAALRIPFMLLGSLLYVLRAGRTDTDER